jgi:hypothetical protein
MIYRAAGVNGVIELYPDRLKILRPSGCLSPFPKGEKVVFYSKLSGLQFKDAGKLSGFVQFIFSGSSESKGGTWDAAKDENTVMFAAKDRLHFLYIKDFVEDRIAHPASTTGAPPKTAGIDDLERLAELKNKGIITEEEFAAKKKQILGL